jgi:4a-hydroxytetrahydrobiopterin dehydratase
MSQRDKLSDEDIGAFLVGHPGWERVPPEPVGSPPALARSFAFDDYATGIAFAVRVAFAAEARNHHPDLHIGWGRVRVVWSTHDAGGVTALDTEMAARTDTLVR